MPFKVTDNETGRIATFENKPTQVDINEAFNIGTAPETAQDRGSFMNRAIAETLGAPVDIAAGALNLIPGVDIQQPFLGSESIKRGMEAIGIDIPEEGERPETVAEYVGTGIGEVSSLLIPFGGAAKLVSKGAGLTGRIAKSIYTSMVKHPALTITGEISAGAGAGAGRFVGEEQFPDRPLVRPLAEISGGVAGALVPTAALHTPAALAFRAGRGLVRKAGLPFTEAGAKFRAGQFLKKQVTEADIAAGRAIEPTIGELPPIVATGEKRLMALLKQIRDADPTTDSETIEQISKSIFKLEQELRSFGYGAPEILRETTRKRIASLELKMDERVLRATDNAQRKLEALPIAERKAQESVIVRNELHKVMQSESAIVKEKWADVPKQLKVGFDKSKQAYKNIIADLSKAEKGDIPEILKSSFLAKKGKEITKRVVDFTGKKITIIEEQTTTTLKEMQGLRSKLLEEARIARAGNKWNTARIADDVADSILDDLGAIAESAATPEGEALSTAIAATRQFKSRFQQGIVGKMLGFQRTGAPTISPDLALDISIGRMGARGAIDIDKITVTPEAIMATERYLGRSFADYTTSKGTREFNPSKAQQWVKNNEAILDKFPNLRAKMQDATEAQNLATQTKTLMEARKARLQDPKISTSANFLRTDIGKEVDTILKSDNPARMTKELVRQARKDPTGESLDGLRGSFIDNMLEKSSIGPYNELGEQTLSGRVMLANINKNKGTLREVFSQEQIVRMERIAGELAKLEQAESIRGAGIEINLDDIASNMLRLVSRIGGAQIGRVLARMTGGGTVQTPGIVSERFKNFATRLTKDRAFQLVHDAVIAKDGQLLRALLLPIDKPTTAGGRRNLVEINKQMNLWLIGTGSRVLNDISEEIREDQTTPEPELGAL